jgi:hypothetical protein
MATLAALRPDFPTSKVVKALSDSPHPAIAVVHKAFGSKYSNLQDIIYGLLGDPVGAPDCLTVVVYVECGPCRPPRRPVGYFPLISPKDDIAAFNRKLDQKTPRLLKKIKKEIAFIKANLPVDPRINYIIMTGLEDNFTDKGHQVMAELVDEVFEGSVVVGRNRLYFQERAGRVDEYHSIDMEDLRRLKKGDILNFDGEIMCYSGETGCEGTPQFGVEFLIEEAQALGIGLMLWRPEWQGLPANADVNNPVVLPPWERTYKVPFINKIKKLLRITI